MKRLSKSTILPTILITILALQTVAITVAYVKINTLRKADNSNLLALNQQNTSAAAITALNAVGFSQPAVSVSENRVYLTDLKLSLALNDTTSSLLYAKREVGAHHTEDHEHEEGEGQHDEELVTVYDVSTRALVSLSPIGFQQQLACNPIRLAFEDKSNPFNPNESNSASVKLADGRTLQIYAGGDPQCQNQWEAANISPDNLKKEFEQARSY